MSTINERFREAREHLELSQEEFAQKANRTRSEIKNIEYNKTSPKEEVIKAVCSAHRINRKFLENGEQPIILPDIDETTEYINNLVDERDNPFYETIRAILREYAKAPKEDQDAIKRFVKGILDEKKKGRD